MHVNSLLLRILPALSLCLCTAAPCLGGAPFSMEVISNWGGPVSGLEFVGNTAFIGAGRRLVALDMSNEANITEIGSIDMRCTVQDLAIRDGLAYVTTRNDLPGFPAFTVVDISNPQQMFIVGQGNGFGIYKPRWVHLRGDRALVQDGGSIKVDVFEITDPSNPAYLLEYDSLGAEASSVHGDFVYAATRIWNKPLMQDRLLFCIYDLSQPSVPPLPGPQVGCVEFPFPPGAVVEGGQMGYISCVDVDGIYAYVTVTFGGYSPDWLAIINVSNPQQPLLVSLSVPIANFRNYLTRVSVENGHAYVTGHSEMPFFLFTDHSVVTYLPPDFRGLAIVDIASNPSQPTVVGTYNTHGTVRAVKVIGNRAYLFDDGEGLIILDVTNPSNPQRIGHYYSPAYLRRTVKVGDLLYVVDHWNGFTILDISRPDSTPDVVGVYQTPFNIPNGSRAVANWDIAVSDGKAYLSAGSYGLQIVDVSDPSQPTFIGGYVLNDPCTDSHFAALALVPQGSNLFAYVSYLKDGCEVQNLLGPPPRYILKLNVTNPLNIVNEGTVTTTDMLRRIIVTPNNTMAFACQEMMGNPINAHAVLTMNVSQPGLPQIIHSQAPPHGVWDIALDGDVLHMTHCMDWSGTTSGLYVRDVSTPSAPVLLAHVNRENPEGLLFTASAVAAQNQRAYVAGGFGAPAPGGGFGGGFPWTICYDMANPAEPHVQGYVLAGDHLKSSILAEEPYLYVTTHNGNDGHGASAWPVDHGLSIIQIHGIAPCPADITGNGTVNVDDLLAIINSWGPCLPPASNFKGGVGSGDMNCDGRVDTDDIEPFMLALNDLPAYLNQWFPPCTEFNGDMNGNGFGMDDLPLFCQAAGGILQGNQCIEPPPCPADIAPPPDGNHIVNVDDLLAVINGWGACE